MSFKDRQARLKRYGGIYRKFGFVRDDNGNLAGEQRCAYCGIRAEDEDHVPPLNWVYCLGSGYFDDRGIPFLIVPACKECNSTLSDTKAFSLRERTIYILGKYLKKYKKLLTNSKWEQEEIDELGRELRSKIQPFAICQSWIDRRIQAIEENLRSPKLP